MNIRETKLRHTVTIVSPSAKNEYGEISDGGTTKNVPCFAMGSRQRVNNEKEEEVTADFQVYIASPWLDINWKLTNCKGIDGVSIFDSGVVRQVRPFHSPYAGYVLQELLIVRG